MLQSKLRATLVTASLLVVCGCSQVVAPANVESLKDVVGDKLPGAKGQTIEDQNKIDDAMAGLCASGVYGKKACSEHTEASRSRRLDG